ncbi:AAA family ATPase [Desulfobacterales bacterium HSG2]|nr:AAA family ATPase [Desulfobacterales bacterium HSG2]
MLESLYIKNYRLFRELRIDSLKRVNLIIGKNNAGKSSLLEAIATYLSRDEIALRIYTLSCERGEWTENDFEPKNVLNSLTALFYDRKITLNQTGNAIHIGTDENRGVSFSLINNSKNRRKQPVLVIEEDKNKVEELPLSDFKNCLPISFAETQHKMVKAVSPLSMDDRNKLLSLYWSEIALTEKEDYVIEALRIVDENIERLAFVDGTSGVKKPIIRLRNVGQPFALGSMGSGVVHILTTILFLVHCENGTLLIDEFESGLHWSVQAELWEFIYLMAEKFNVQIFASTHSRDTLWALQQVALSKGAEEETSIIKLLPLPKKRKIKAVEVDIENVKLALEQELEIR